MRMMWRNAPLLLAVAALAWGGNAIVGRAVADTVPPVLLALLRWSGACVVVTCLAWKQVRRDWPAMRRAWPAMLALSATGIAAFNTLLYQALHDTTALNTLLLQSAIPLFIMGWDLTLFRQPAGPRQIGAILVSLAGVAVIAGQGSLATLGALRVNPGDALMMLAVVIYALYSSLLRKRPAVHAMSFLSGSFALGALMLVPLALWEHAQGAVLHPTPGALAGIAYVCLVPSCLAYLCFNRGVELIGAARAGQFMHLVPVFGTVLAVLLLGETLHAWHVAGIALIAAGLALAGGVMPRSAPAAARVR